MNTLKVSDGDILFFGAGQKEIVNASLGALRLAIAKDLNLINKKWSALWVIDFPMFEYDQGDSRWYSLHHPFTSPKAENLDDFDNTDIAVLSNIFFLEKIFDDITQLLFLAGADRSKLNAKGHSPANFSNKKSILFLEDNKKIEKKKKVAKTFMHKCPLCSKTFEKPQGIGGHMSKAHPGESKVYEEKMKTRKKRAPERDALKQA